MSIDDSRSTGQEENQALRIAYELAARGGHVHDPDSEDVGIEFIAGWQAARKHDADLQRTRVFPASRNKLTLKARGTLAQADVVSHSAGLTGPDLYPNLLLVMKLMDAQVLASDADIPDGQPPMNKMVLLTVITEWG
jgi:hypothetical protein